MAQVFIKYNPYKLETEIKINSRDITPDSELYKVTKGKRLQEWIGEFPEMLVESLNTIDFDIEFYGTELDYDDIEDVFDNASDPKNPYRIINPPHYNFIKGKSDEDITDKVVNVFNELKEGPVEDFRDYRLLKAFSNINNSIFPINVIATMSSGKSTLINALIGKRLMPSKNEACTSIITEILDNDCEEFAAVVYDKDNIVLEEIPKLTYEKMYMVNDDPDVQRVYVNGNIPFLDSKGTALMMVDTPGPNNARNQEHKNTTYRAINSDSNNLIIYVLNGTQLLTNDDATLLEYVAKQMKEGGKQARDRFLFVVNKMDGFDPESENIESVMKNVENYLSSYGIDNPQIFPCSAFAALNIRTYFKDIDIDNLTRVEEKALPSAARDTLSIIDKLTGYESMHLEQYSKLSPSGRREINYKLSCAEKNGDTKEIALIHSGIYSIEAAITAYVKKYAKTKKVKDLVESFREVLERTSVLAKAKDLVANDEKAAKALAERAAVIKEKINSGKEAAVFKDKIAALNPKDSIESKANDLKMEILSKTGKLFEPYDDTITNKDEAKRLVTQFALMSSDCVAELTADLENIINHEVFDVGENLIKEYQEKLRKMDEDAADQGLEFNTVDLIKGILSNMKENASRWCSDEFADETIDEIGETTYEEKVYYEKTGQKEEEVFDRFEKVKVGTHKVKSGQHKEKTGTRTVKNPERKGVFGFFKFWEPKFIEEDVYEMVDDYKDEDIFETRAKYKKVMKDIYEERVEKIEKFSVDLVTIQSGLISNLKRNMDDGINEAIKFANAQVIDMKEQFTKLFDKLDEMIKEKYIELEVFASDQKTKEKELEENRKLLSWIENRKSEIEELLEI